MDRGVVIWAFYTWPATDAAHLRDVGGFLRGVAQERAA